MNTGFDTRGWLRWVGSFIGFPLAGLAAKAVTGPIDSSAAAVVGGLAAGATLGAVQSLALRLDTRHRIAWTAATALGASAGLALGSTLVDFATDTSSLVAMGAITGVGIGLAQAAVMPGSPARRVTWAVVTPILWALGWLITSQVIVDVDAQYANFGATGAIVATLLGGLVLAVGAAGTDSSGVVRPHRSLSEVR
jgi:hypothetical protein